MALKPEGRYCCVELAELLLILDDLALLDGRVAWVYDDVRFEVEHGFELTQGDVEQVADAAGQALEEPDVRAGAGELDVAEALAADLREGDFYAALVADDAAVLHALVLAAEAFPVGDGSEDAGAEEAVAFGLEGAVVDGFWLGDFAMRPAADLLGAGELDLDGVEVGDGAGEFKGAGAKHILRLRCSVALRAWCALLLGFGRCFFRSRAFFY